MSKVYFSYADSRNFSFDAIALTKDKAEKIVKATLKKHGQQYGLPGDWHKGNVEIFTREIELEQGYRDRSKV